MSTEPFNAGATRSGQFAATLMDILERVEYRRVPLDDPNHPVFRLRYDAYRREEFIPANQDEITTDELDQTPNVMCYGVYIDGDLVSSVRLHHLTADHRHSVSMRPFGDILHPLLDRGMHFIDPSRFTTDRDASLAFPALPYLTLRIAAMACEHYRPNYCLSAVRPEHGAFYKRVFAAKPWADARSVGGDIQFSVCLQAADFRDIRERVYTRYPFFMSTHEERALLFGPTSEANFIQAIQPTARTAALATNRFVPVS